MHAVLQWQLCGDLVAVAGGWWVRRSRATSPISWSLVAGAGGGGGGARRRSPQPAVDKTRLGPDRFETPKPRNAMRCNILYWRYGPLGRRECSELGAASGEAEAARPTPTPRLARQLASRGAGGTPRPRRQPPNRRWMPDALTQ
jgi:hypothetical protein